MLIAAIICSSEGNLNLFVKKIKDINEHTVTLCFSSDLSKHLVQNYTDVEELMDAGNINRTTAATGMNDVSSRSHAIFTINFTQVMKQDSLERLDMFL